MESLSLDHILTALLKLGVLIFSLCLHEFGHAFVADKMGDPTPRMLGRLTLDPRAHADLIGTVLFPLMMFLFPGFIMIGWAKPVPITPDNFRHPKRDSVFVSLAGPASNVFLAVASAAAMALLLGTGDLGMGQAMAFQVVTLLKLFFWINFALFLFNLIPIPPLDGSWVAKAVLTGRWAWRYAQVERYGFLILLACLYLGLLKWFFMPALWALEFFFHMAGLDGLAAILFS